MATTKRQDKIQATIERLKVYEINYFLLFHEHNGT